MHRGLGFPGPLFGRSILLDLRLALASHGEVEELRLRLLLGDGKGVLLHLDLAGDGEYIIFRLGLKEAFQDVTQ